jgi:hypothetical protein
VLVIDRIEFEVVYQALQIRHFDYRNAIIPQRFAKALDEAVQVGYMGEHIVGVDNVGASTFGDELPRQINREKRF